MAPNIVVIVCDDQPKGLFGAMPVTRSEIIAKGTNFRNYVCTTALCSPSRAALLSGLYSHNNGTWTNQTNLSGGWPAYAHNEVNNINVHLQNAGYHTALLGKYMNKFSASGQPGYIPPGWDDFLSFLSGDAAEGAGSYFNYQIVGTIPTETYGTAEADYSTDVLKGKAVSVINNAPTDKPLFLWFATWGPHGPMTPAPRHVGLWPAEGNIPLFNEPDITDKPAWVQALPLADATREAGQYTDMHEVMMSIDEAISAILQALTDTNRLNDTLIIYLSDNGKMLGSHRAVKKDLAYKWAAEVPMMMRWDADSRIGVGVDEQGLIANIDIPATIAEAAGLTTWNNKDGRSYLSLSRAGVVIEQMNNPEQDHPAYVGWRTRRYLYVEWTKGEAGGRELYDYDTDPNEDHNLAFDPTYATLADDMLAQAQQNASPTPPGFQWRGQGLTCAIPGAGSSSGGGGGGGGGTANFTGDPGMGSKLYVGVDAFASSDRWNLIADFMQGPMRSVSADSVLYPANSNVAPGCYRGFNGSINDEPSFGAHGDASWSIFRKAMANTGWVSWTFDSNSATTAASIFNGDHNTWIDNTLAPFLQDCYDRYGTAMNIDLGNEPDAWGNAPNQSRVPLWHTNMRRASRYLHFRLKDHNSVPVAAFYIGTPTFQQATAYDHVTRHAIPIHLTETQWLNNLESNRGDAIYYYIADWKGTRTNWANAFDPKTADFIQPGEPDEWGYGSGPITRVFNNNVYERTYERSHGFASKSDFAATLASTSDRIGNLFRFNKALYGGTTPVLKVSSANNNGIPINIGEWGWGVMNAIPGSTNPTDPKVTADVYTESIMPDLVANNVIAINKWRYVSGSYGGTDTNSDTFTFHWKVAEGPGDGTHTYDNHDANTKGYAAIFSSTFQKNPPKWPNGHLRPPQVTDMRGFGDV